MHGDELVEAHGVSALAARRASRSALLESKSLSVTVEDLGLG